MALSVVLLPILACSKTDDIPAQREIFGAPPVIVNAELRVNETSTTCDFTDEYNVWLRDSGLPLEVNRPLFVGIGYTELDFEVHISDADSDPNVPGEDDILAVTATYVPPGQGGGDGTIVTEESLVLFDDGSANKFSYSQQGSVNIKCTEDTFGYITCQQLIDFILTSNDPIGNDGHFSRRMASFNLALSNIDTTLVVQDCLAVQAFQVPISAGDNLPFTFRIDVVDRAGNITTWPTELPATVQSTEFVCEGDECFCCFLEFNALDQCSGLPGLQGICGG
jgi:hypothetical protein